MLSDKFFISGSDFFSIAKKGDAIARSFQQRDIEIISGDAVKAVEVVDELSRVIESLRTVSLFSQQKFVWYKNVNFLSDTTLSRSEEIVSWLEVLQRTLEERSEVGFLLTVGNVDRRQKSIKWFMEHCQSESFEEPKQSNCEQYILGKIRDHGKKISTEAAHKILQQTGNHLMTIDNELEKLLLYAAQQDRITVEDVESIIVDLNDSDFFETVELFFREDALALRRGIQRYFLYQEDGRPLLSALQNRVRFIVQLRYFFEEDHIEQVRKDVIEKLKQKYFPKDDSLEGSIFAQNPWYLGKLLEIAKKYPLKNWIRFQVALLEAVADLSQNYREQLIVFEQLYFHLKASSSVWYYHSVGKIK